MPDRDPGLKFNGVLLRPDQVVPGMTVALALEGKETYEVGQNGRPLVLRVLIGGVPARTKLYSSSVTGDLNGSFEVNKFGPSVRLMPVEVFRPGELPPNREFVAFRGGERLRYEQSRDGVRIKTDGESRAISDHGYQYGWWGREYPLPEDAILVPVDIPERQANAPSQRQT